MPGARLAARGARQAPHVALTLVASAMSIGGLLVIPVSGVARATPPPAGAKPDEIIALAGGGTAVTFGAKQPASGLQLADPRGTAVDSTGNVYIADTNNNIVEKVTAAGVATVVAGDGIAGGAGDDRSATSAQLDHPEGIAISSAGVLYIADTGNNEIRAVHHGVITTVAGDGAPGYTGDGGSAVQAELDSPYGVAVLGSTIDIADTGNNVVRQVAKPKTGASTISTLAGGGLNGIGDGGKASLAELSQPTGVAIDHDGNVYIADSADNAIREVNGKGIIRTAFDAPYPRSVALDSHGDIAVADPADSEVLEKMSGGALRVVAGSRRAGYSGNNGIGTAAQLDHPAGVAVDQYGDVFVADSGNDRVREVVAARRPDFVSHSVPKHAKAHKAYGAKVVATGVPVPSYRLAGGAPSWLTVTRHGTVKGSVIKGRVPAHTKSFTFTVVAHNGSGSRTIGPFKVKVHS